MMSDYAPIIHRLDGRTIKIWAIADVHIGAREADLYGFERFLKRIAESPDDYLVLCGDIINNGIRDSLTNVYEETMPPSAQIDKAVELLEPVADRILGAVGGNHEARSKMAVDLDPMHTIMTILRIQDLYRQNFAIMRVNLENGRVRDSYALMLIHGKSEAKRKKFDLAVEGVDAIIGGHTHSPLAAKSARLVFTHNNNINVEPFISLTASSWLDYGGYAAASLYVPTAASDPQALQLEYTGTNSRPGRISVVW